MDLCVIIIIIIITIITTLYVTEKKKHRRLTDWLDKMTKRKEVHQWRKRSSKRLHNYISKLVVVAVTP